MPETLKDRNWTILLRRIEKGLCTPFLGAGACAGVLPLGGDIARAWAAEYNYPLKDTHDLARVAQFLAIQYDPMFPKEELLDQWFQGEAQPDYDAPAEPHGVLADLPLPVYMTTNYDHFMVDALKSRNKDPKRELCRWNQQVKNYASVFDDDEFEPTVANPVVYHLHGHDQEAGSLVLTEDDYLDFLVNISKDENLLPKRIKESLAGTSLLFIGYGLADWDFRVLFRGLVTATEGSLRRISVTVQLPPAAGPTPQAADPAPPAAEQMQGYLNEYFGELKMSVYWGTAQEFMAELQQRWKEHRDGR